MIVNPKVIVFETTDSSDALLALAFDEKTGQVEVYYNAVITEWKWCRRPAVLMSKSLTSNPMWLKVTNVYDSSAEPESDLLYTKECDDEGRSIETVSYGGRTFQRAIDRQIDISTVVDIPDDRELKYLAEERTLAHPPQVVLLTVNRWQPDDVSRWRLYDGTWGDFSQMPITKLPIVSYGDTHVQSNNKRYVFSSVIYGGGRMFQLVDSKVVLNYETALWLERPSTYDFQESDGRVTVTKK